MVGPPRAHEMCQSSSGHYTARSDTPMQGKPRSGLPAGGGAARCSMSDVFWCGAVGTVVLVRPAGQETRCALQFNCCAGVRDIAQSGDCLLGLLCVCCLELG